VSGHRREIEPGTPMPSIGHADLIAAAGETWAVVLGVRPVDGTLVLSRETFLVPVVRSDAGTVADATAAALPKETS